MSNVIFLLCFSLTFGFVFCDLNDTFIRCCSLGKKKFSNPSKCAGKMSTPIPGIEVDQQSICLATIELCCIQYLRNSSCRNGTRAAKANKSCDMQRNGDEEISYKFCCEACKLGMIAGSTATCDAKAVYFGSPWDETYQLCCEETFSTQPPTTTNVCSLLGNELCSHTCVSTGGSYRCECRSGYTLLADGKSCQQDLGNRCDRNNPCEQNCFDTGSSVLCSCNEGFALASNNKSCEDVDECKEQLHDCDLTKQVCVNTVGSHSCLPKVTRTPPISTPTDSFPPTTSNRPTTNRNADIDECKLKPCFSNEVCTNTVGSYECHCAVGFQRDRMTGACIDINECQQNSQVCEASQRCDNTIGSYFCVRATSCGTGYTFNSQTLVCEDDDECALGIDNCRFLGSDFECKNTMGSFRCEKKSCRNPFNCPPITHVKCPKGYVLNGEGTCVDVNECQKGNICPGKQSCVNSIGSYRCVTPSISRNCGPGLKLNETINSCEDINECKEQPGVCDHTCYNTYGSFRCACRSGFVLHHDHRSCLDINECTMFKGGRLCAATCINEPGSYKCQCPEGYKLGSDGAACVDIDECVTEAKCSGPDEVCLNVRGSYRCNSIVCPQNYVRNADKKNRCSRASYYCPYNNEDCLKMPLSYYYSYMSFVSNIQIPNNGQIDLFNVKGPPSNKASVIFSLELRNVNAPLGVPKVTEDYFYLNQVSWNSVTVALVKSIVGPQEIELDLRMQITESGAYVGYNLSKLFIVVSQYEF